MPLVMESFVAISLFFSIASQMQLLMASDVFASCVAMPVKNLPVSLTSPLPLEKKELALRQSCSWHWRAIVRVTVDFPLPAIPFNQKTHLSSSRLTHAVISLRTSTRVSGRQIGSWCLLEELKAALVAEGNNLSKSSLGTLVCSL